MTTQISDARRSLLARLHIGKKQLGLDDDTYRAWLKKTISVESGGDATDAQLVTAIGAMKDLGFKADRPSQADSGHARKIRALWLSLHNLGAVRNSSEAALTAYVKRQAKVDSLKFLAAIKARPVIESLKDWCVREGFDAGLVDPIELRIALLQAQFMKLFEIHAIASKPRDRADRASFARYSDGGVRQIRDWVESIRDNCADRWRQGRLPAIAGLKHWTAEDLDAFIGHVGNWLRREIAGRTPIEVARP